MGSRVPVMEEDDSRFMYHHPPLMLFETPPPALPRNEGLEEPLEAPPRMGRPTGNFPRLPARMLR
jgi:hypothetical protein